MFRRMIETTAKSTWWTILFELGSIIMRVILMALTIVVASVIASSVTVWSIIVSTMATATSILIIAIIIIILATTGGIKLSMVALVLASIIFFVAPFPFAENLYMVFYHYIGPCRVYGLSCYLYNSNCDSNCLHFHSVFLVQGEGEVVEVAVVVWIYLYFSFLLNLLHF